MAAHPHSDAGEVVTHIRVDDLPPAAVMVVLDRTDVCAW